jgi:hypothetical protein
MKIDIRPQKLGKMLCLGLVLALSACRTSQPPPKEICILDGHGGGDCVESDGMLKYRLPSEMLNYWATNQVDMQNFSAWCYNTTPQTAHQAMAILSEQARAELGPRDRDLEMEVHRTSLE